MKPVNELARIDLPVPPERAFISPRLQLGLDYVAVLNRRAEARKSPEASERTAPHPDQQSEGDRA